MIERMSKEEIAKRPIRRYQGRVRVVRSKGQLADAVGKLRKETLLGFDTETRPAFKKGQSYKPSLIQLAGRREVFVFQLKHIGLPRPLRRILAEPRIVKAGVALDRDVIELAELAPFEPAGFVDLGKVAKEVGLQNHGLRGLVAVLLGFRIPKSAQTSNWSKSDLTPAQITYAATDAWVGRELYRKMRERFGRKALQVSKGQTS
jgi:ribonuclease D